MRRDDRREIFLTTGIVLIIGAIVLAFVTYGCGKRSQQVRLDGSCGAVDEPSSAEVDTTSAVGVAVIEGDPPDPGPMQGQWMAGDSSALFGPPMTIDSDGSCYFMGGGTVCPHYSGPWVSAPETETDSDLHNGVIPHVSGNDWTNRRSDDSAEAELPASAGGEPPITTPHVSPSPGDCFVYTPFDTFEAVPQCPISPMQYDAGDCTYLNGKLVHGDSSCPTDQLGVDPNFENDNPAGSAMQDSHGDMYECHESGNQWLCQQQPEPMPSPSPSPDDEDEQDSLAI